MSSQHFVSWNSSVELKVSILRAILFISHTFAYISSVQLTLLAPVIEGLSLTELSRELWTKETDIANVPAKSLHIITKSL